MTKKRHSTSIKRRVSDDLALSRLDETLSWYGSWEAFYSDRWHEVIREDETPSATSLGPVAKGVSA
jgi:hypothetical protein